MIQLILARTVSSLCNCVTYFSGSSRSPGPNFHYRGFNKTRNDQTEYEIDSLLMEDDLVDELVATPLSAEEIAAKLSNSNAKHVPNNILGGRDININSNSGARGADIWIAGGGSSMGIGGGGGGLRVERNENKISNDWWSDGEDDDDDGFSGTGGRGIMSGSNQTNEKIINTTFFNTTSGLANGNNLNNIGVIPNHGGNSIERDLYFDENIDELSFQGNNSNNNQLQKDNWDKEFLNDYRDDQSFDFVPIKENLDNFGISTDLRTEQVDKDLRKDDEIIFDSQRDLLDYKDSNAYNHNSNHDHLNWNYGYNDSNTINDKLDNNVPPMINNQNDKLLEKDFGDFGDFGDFTSGNSPNHFLTNNDDINNHQNETEDEYFESATKPNLISGYTFDQETDDISLKESSDYHNNQTTTDQNNILEVENAMDNFCDFTSPKRDEQQLIYNHRDSFDHISFDANTEDTNNNIIITSNPIQLGQESGFGMESENPPESIRGHLLDDFDDIFNSSFPSNSNLTNNNKNTISTFDHMEKNFQTNNNTVSTYEDDEFGMFDFVSAKSPPSDDHLKATAPMFNSDQHHNTYHQPSVLLE
ncbi:uncharacterized protein cubi_00709 [Cryptosporidium ubiquitum]|uniref:Uncharacterized protein n=1 Tax=Cryptosporidium ubiquitum TaxID=857276 RepID=A0A1J4MGB5_9CRYT|nr:uncharacterized protein cubi_00709 [Cryptosporidium ubiquitum]OII71901.1 hypothetical protein cubi_00709 [Cryptosporidium ubiquitum]